MYREVARALAQMHSIQLPEGRREPGVIIIIVFIYIIIIIIIIKHPEGRRDPSVLIIITIVVFICLIIYICLISKIIIYRILRTTV